MSSEKNIADAVFRFASQHPDRLAYLSQDQDLSQAKMTMAIRAFAIRMRDHGIGPESLVMLDTTSPLVSLSILGASSLLGARITPYSKTFLNNAKLRPTHIIRSPEIPDRGIGDVVKIDQTWSPAVIDLETATFAAVDTTQPWLMMSSAGTTGSPKLFTLSQAIAHDRIRAIGKYSLAECQTNLLLFPANSRPFFIRALAALLNGTTIVDIIDPEALNGIGIDLVCGSPYQATHWLAQRTLTPRFKRLLVTGARLHEQDAKKLLQSFEVVEDVYGASETNQSFVNEITMQDSKCVKRGRWLDSRIEIVNQSFQPCAPGEIGMVRVSNGNMIDGYIGLPKATATAFQDGWFYPGDFARWAENDVLDVKGRVDETINLGGVKVNLKAVDEVMLSVPGVASAVSFRNPDPAKVNELMAFVMLDDIDRRNIVIPKTRDACVTTLGHDESPSSIIVVESLPMTIDGAPRRTECQRLALILQQE
jgi:acyl-CoA synthetase (AMP-forming)/AMP-acid ligase II